MAHQRNQTHLIKNLNKYFESQQLPIRWNEAGVCHGLAVLHCKYVLEHREKEYFDILDKISKFDKLKEAPDEAVDRFVFQVIQAFKPRLFADKTQRDSFSMLEVNGDELLTLSMIAPVKEWENILESLNLQQDEVMLLSTTNHSMSVSRKGNQYCLADSNDPEGFTLYDNAGLLLKAITQFYPGEGDYGLNIQMLRNKEHHETPRTPPLPNPKDIYKTANRYARNGNCTQWAYACINDNIDLVSELLNQFPDDIQHRKLIKLGLKSAVMYSSIETIKKILEHDEEWLDPETIDDLTKAVMRSGTYEALKLLTEHKETGEYVALSFKKENAAEHITSAAHGGNPDILKEVITNYTNPDYAIPNYTNPDRPTPRKWFLTSDDLAQIILTKNQKNVDAIEAAIGEKGHCGLSNEQSVSFLLEKVLQANQKLDEHQFLHYILLAIKTNQPHLVTLFAEQIEKTLSKENHDALFQAIQLSTSMAQQTDYSILETLQSHGTKHSTFVEGIMKKKAMQPPGILLTIGITLQRFSEWVKGLTIENTVQQCMTNFKELKQYHPKQQEPESIEDEEEGPNEASTRSPH